MKKAYAPGGAIPSTSQNGNYLDARIERVSAKIETLESAVESGRFMCGPKIVVKRIAQKLS
jgi:hypothetical protein